MSNNIQNFNFYFNEIRKTREANKVKDYIMILNPSQIKELKKLTKSIYYSEHH